MSRAEVYAEFDKARREFERIYGEPAQTAGAAGWQANSLSLAAYDDAGLLYASDTRGTHAFFPRANKIVFKTLQIPTTLPTLDELLGRPEHRAPGRTVPVMAASGTTQVRTAHAEIEGMIKIDLFRVRWRRRKTECWFRPPGRLAREHLRERDRIPVAVDSRRSGRPFRTLAAKALSPCSAATDHT
jgi:hypothetical protein